MDSVRGKRPRPSRARRWQFGIGIGCFLLAVSATIPWFNTPDTDRLRRLAQTHEGKAAECRRLEQQARATGHHEEAQVLARSARNFARFAAAYRSRSAVNRLSWLTLLVDSLAGRR